MIVKDIIKTLEKDSELKLLLNPTPDDTKIHVEKTGTPDSIVYRFVNLMSDRIKEQNRLEISCLSYDYLKANEILERVKNVLLTFCDNQFNDDILEIALNGGGYLYDEDTNIHIVKAFFIVKNRYRR